MRDSEKKGLFGKIFGGSKSSCCNIRIEEVPEDSTEKRDEQRPSPCCGGAYAVPDDASRAGSDSAKTD